MIWAQQGRWISDAEVAETRYTAFTSTNGQAVTAGLIVRRVRDQNHKAEAQSELFPVWRYHPVFTDSPFMIHAEEQHRDHAVIEQVFADLTAGPLAHAQSGVFAANAAWLALAAIAHNLTRAARRSPPRHGHRPPETPDPTSRTDRPQETSAAGKPSPPPGHQDQPRHDQAAEYPPLYIGGSRFSSDQPNCRSHRHRHKSGSKGSRRDAAMAYSRIGRQLVEAGLHDADEAQVSEVATRCAEEAVRAKTPWAQGDHVATRQALSQLRRDGFRADEEKVREVTHYQVQHLLTASNQEMLRRSRTGEALRFKPQNRPKD